MKKGGKGGEKTQTGLVFEKKVDLTTLLSQTPGYKIEAIDGMIGVAVFFEDRSQGWQLVARCFKKRDFYKFLEEKGVDWKSKITRQLIPDDALYVIVRETLFIIEVKYQQIGGSADEKLQTCDFKRKQYLKLVSELGLKVEYVYVLDDWFKKPIYQDVLSYIHSVNCHYKFGSIPLAWLGLPSP